ncbi:protein phosphatase 2C 70 [Typha angustifolia]|uniref:protein phosphatase 2C 70 n=1 Tax=Typha angustifolia TaxID=59011 RepID=UPI003C2F5DEF
MNEAEVVRPFQGALLGLSLARSMGATEMSTSLLSVSLLVMLALVLLLLLFLLLVCRPWRFFSSPASSRRLSSANTASTNDLNRPLFSENLDDSSGRSYDFARNVVEEARIQIDENRTLPPPRTHVFANKKRIHPTESRISQGDSLVLDVSNGMSEDVQVNYTLKRTAALNWPASDAKHVTKYNKDDVKHISDSGRNQAIEVKDISLRSSLTLEVIDGPSRGLCCSQQSSSTSMLPLTLGRVPPSGLLLKDSEVSGKHAIINWNMKTSRWELVDVGSLNGTFLNSKAVHHPDVGSRRWSEPAELADGDIITLGTSSKVSVQIHIEHRIPAGVGMASDPMAIRQGGKALPMEDMYFCQYPLSGVEQFGLFGICDGHGGNGAAEEASKTLPENVANLLSHPERKQRVLSRSDASDVLRDAFSLTESAMNHQYEGCTATALLIWFDHNKECFAQCANVGDSACVININGQQITMTEDHRVTSMIERTRMAETGRPLKEGATRLWGINISRMLGDKFLKEQDTRFSSEPYVSQVVHITKGCTAFALIASDGLWDVISIRNAVQLVLQNREKINGTDENSAERLANVVLNEARTLRTKDNTSVVFLDFDTLRTDSCMTKS